jgi:hypothetical protein
MTNTAMLWIIVVLSAVAIVFVMAIASRQRARARSVELRHRFGPEYDRAVNEFGSLGRAERELGKRARRVAHLQFRELNDAERLAYASSWSRIQGQFIDDPAAAVVRANELIKEVMRAQGYPIDDFEQRVVDLSVDHASVVQHYRAARALAESNRDGGLNTEDLRQAVVHFRALFADLLQNAGSPSRQLREQHA